MRFPRDVPDSIWERFCEVHGDLFTADYWAGVQKELARGDLPDFYPYPQRLRFRRRSAEAAE
jgi:isocitrate dehydrogenase kinase/phosphatase